MSAKPELMPVAYKINDLSRRGFRWVHGYAINSDVGVRMAVHIRDTGLWVCDHWDTGFCFGNEYEDRDECVEEGIKEMRRRIASGELAKAVAKAIRKTRIEV